MLVLPLEQILRQQSQSAPSNTFEAPAINTPAPTVNPAPAQNQQQRLMVMVDMVVIMAVMVSLTAIIKEDNNHA